MKPAISFARMARAVERELRHAERAMPVRIQQGRLSPEMAEVVLRELRATHTYLAALAQAHPHEGPQGPITPPPHYTDAA